MAMRQQSLWNSLTGKISPQCCDALGHSFPAAPRQSLLKRSATFTFFCATEVEALATVRLGSPANPLALNAIGSPVIASNWQVQIDHTAFAPGALADIVLVDM